MVCAKVAHLFVVLHNAKSGEHPRTSCWKDFIIGKVHKLLH